MPGCDIFCVGGTLGGSETRNPPAQPGPPSPELLPVGFMNITRAS